VILDASRCILTHVIAQAHTDKVNSIQPIRVAPFGFVSTSADKHVKVWSEEGQVMGDISLVKEITRLSEWKFAFDWQA